MSRSLCALAVAAVATTVGSAHAATIITFADPALGPDTPLFELSGNQLTGGWTGLGLTLETPGLAAPNYSNVQFTFQTVTVTPTGVPPFFQLGAGRIDFYEPGDLMNPLVTITFAGGLLTDALGFGASTFAGFNVEFTGSIIPPGTPSNEAFSFSFANQVGSPDAYTATASFTSSADNIPAPATIGLLGAGLLVAGRRRR